MLTKTSFRHHISSLQMIWDLTSDYVTNLQLPRHYGIGTNTEIQINGTKQKVWREIHTPMETLSLTKEAKIYNGEKTTSLTSCAGKTGQ